MILWKNTNIFPLLDDTTTYNQMITHQGKIVALGDLCELYEPTQVIDLKGNFVFPAFIDTHMHLIGYGRRLQTHHLNNTRNKAHAFNQIQSFYQQSPLYIEGYFNVGLTKTDLDTISSSQPIILRHNDYHSFTVNSYILNQLKIHHPTGIMIEHEANLILPLWSKFSKNELILMTRNAIKSLHQFGVSTILTDDLAYFNSFEETFEIIRHLSLALKLKTHLLIHENVFDDYLNKKYQTTPFVRFQSIKTFYDGTFSSQTALMYEPYQETHTHGERIHTHQNFENLLKKIRNHHLSIAIHTIGNQAFDEVISLLKKYPNQSLLPDRIIHASSIYPDSLAKINDLHVVFDVQPQFITADLPYINHLFQTKVPFYTFQSMRQKGLLVTFSSDAPVEIPNPILGIKAALNHPDENEQLTPYQALKAYTVDAAKSLGYTNKGLLQVGFIADFIVTNKNLLHQSSYENPNDLFVLQTIIDGSSVYQK